MEGEVFGRRMIVWMVVEMLELDLSIICFELLELESWSTPFLCFEGIAWVFLVQNNARTPLESC
jgi:hypothetical protein